METKPYYHVVYAPDGVPEGDKDRPKLPTLAPGLRLLLYLAANERNEIDDRSALDFLVFTSRRRDSRGSELKKSVSVTTNLHLHRRYVWLEINLTYPCLESGISFLQDFFVKPRTIPSRFSLQLWLLHPLHWEAALILGTRARARALTNTCECGRAKDPDDERSVKSPGIYFKYWNVSLISQSAVSGVERSSIVEKFMFTKQTFEFEHALKSVQFFRLRTREQLRPDLTSDCWMPTKIATRQR